MESLENALTEHPFLKDLGPNHLKYIVECATEMHFDPGTYLLKEGEPANQFFLIKQGKVALGTFVSGRGFVTIQTIGTGEIVGWSWIVPPYVWHFSGLVILPTDAIALDGKHLRELSEEDHDFGYEMIKRISMTVGERLRMTRTLLNA